jgi:hypothetical protein
MFKLAVLGPIVTSGIGVARQCVDCYRGQSSYQGIRCFGFGQGCINYRPGRPMQTADRDDRATTLSAGLRRSC